MAAGSFQGDADSQEPVRGDVFGSQGATEDEHLDHLISNNRYIVGTPKTVINKFRALLEEIRVGILLIWAHEGSVSHQAAMRNIELLGTEVLPALREIAKELDLPGPPVGANFFEKSL